MRKPSVSLKWRFEAKVNKTPTCWLWIASLCKHGYGRFRVGVSHKCAHVVAYGLYIGPVPDGVKVLHKCDVRHCVNPEHLKLGTNQDNTDDMMAKGRWTNGSVVPIQDLPEMFDAHRKAH